VIASDGVWEFLSNEEIATIVKPFFDSKNAEKAAEAVVRESYLRWKREEEGIVDDITCVIVFLDVKLPQQEPSANLMGMQTNNSPSYKEEEMKEAPIEEETSQKGNKTSDGNPADKKKPSQD
jgi:serine/threonine protein phosphatase PrpC